MTPLDVVWTMFWSISAGIIIASLPILLSNLRERTKSPRAEVVTDFAAGVAHSLLRDAGSWDLDNNENWLVSGKANLAISLQPSHLGKVEVWHGSNIGTHQITRFCGDDLRAFERALKEWRVITAVERMRIADKRMREALEKLEV